MDVVGILHALIDDVELPSLVVLPNMSSLDVIDGKWYAAAVVIISMGLLIA
ncbi:hypothetical protein [Coprococcus sp. OM06-25]|uniref:hypothetical protein n=1 Tax=Coprococcus sp. OM06-25 TaxID=2293094 RepID=UPI001314C429|nr:hypothetical protein [Coprococcus sp. OM06-25]